LQSAAWLSLDLGLSQEVWGPLRLHPLCSSEPYDRRLAGPPNGKPAEGGSVDPHSVVNFYVVGPRVETET